MISGRHYQLRQSAAGGVLRLGGPLHADVHHLEVRHVLVVRMRLRAGAGRLGAGQAPLDH